MTATVTDRRLPDRRAAVAEQIERYGPDHFDLCTWFRLPDVRADVVGDYADYGLYRLLDVDLTACGTTGCIGGHAAVVMRDRNELPDDDPAAWQPEAIADWLGMDVNLFLDAPEWAGPVFTTTVQGWRYAVQLMRWLAAHPELTEPSWEAEPEDWPDASALPETATR